ncbi:phage major capsid protein [bacterium]|nr:phage major capsid protein [bacterium]
MNESEYLQDLKGDLANVEAGYRRLESDLASSNDAIKKLHENNSLLKRQLDDMRRSRMQAGDGPDPKRGRFVSEACARYLAAIAIVGAARHNKLEHVSDRDAVLSRAIEALGMEQRSALTTSDIPLPTTYAAEVVELVWMYGQARQFGTVYPLGAATVNLPSLSTSPAFGFIDMSGSVGEKSPQFANKTFTPQKAGGLVRIPSEIDADSIVQLGSFLARYISREMAKWEDTCFFMADGTSTYKSMKGFAKAALDASNKIVLTTGNTAPSDIALSDLRNLRAKVSSAALKQSAYYMNATMEALLITFNSTANGKVYMPGATPKLDGFPVRWVDVMPIYDTSAAASQLQVCFGDASYHYFGERGDLRVETSSDIYFASDEIAVRALERFHVELMQTGAAAVLQLAAS